MPNSPSRRPKSRQPKPRRHLKHKLRSVRMVLTGKSAVKVAKQFGDSARAVSYWVTRFKSAGVDGLTELPHSGRPSRLSVAQSAKVLIHLKKAKAAGKRITGPLLADFIRLKFGVPMTRQHCRRILNRFDLD